MSALAATPRAPWESPRWQVVVRVGDADTFEPPLGRRDQLLPLIMDATTTPTGELGGVVAYNVWPRLDERRLTPPLAAVDLLRAASAVYAADARVPRRTAFDGWTREFVLHLPVAQPEAWPSAITRLADLLAFLTGDHWEVHVRPLALGVGAPTTGRPPVNPRVARVAFPLAADAVCLLSGGLDSFTGAIDELASGRRIAFVSHNTAGSERFTSRSQDDVVNALRRSFGARAFDHFKFRVVPPPAGALAPEDTQRSRSIIFLALGVLVAAALSEQTTGVPTALVIPENGFISLNVPLTPSRLGSCSTRTTHPHTIEGFARVLDALGLRVPLELPYRWMTKGEMLAASRRPAALADAARVTNSCARPNDRNADPARPQRHCGYCVPCIIRRAAMATIGLDAAADYRIDVHADRAALEASAARRSDVRAFELALANAATGAGLADVLTSGPLPDDPQVLEKYVGVYQRGLDEVSRFLVGRPLRG